MSDSKKKETPDGEEAKKKGPLLWIVLAVVLGIGGVAAGIFLAPKFTQSTAAEAPVAAPAASEAIRHDTPPIVVQWPPLVVDVPDEHGGSRHVKLVITLETANEHLEAELTSFAPRGRQAALGYVRAQSFETLTDPTKFEELQKKITELVQQHVGKSAKGEQRVSQVLITDLVAQ